MTFIVLAAAFMAQHTGHHAPQPAPAATTSPAGAAKFTIDATPIADLLADAAAKAIIEKHLPGFSSHPSIGMAGRMTLKGVQQYAQGRITDDHLKMIAEELAALPAK